MSVDSSRRVTAPGEVAEIVLAEVRLGLAEHLADQLTLDSRLGELGLDSLATMEAVNRIEAIFGVRFTEDSLYDIECCRDLVRCVEERTGRPAGSADQAASSDVTATEVTASGVTASHVTASKAIRAPRKAEGDVTQFAECLAFEKRLADTAAAGLPNPFFRVKQAVRAATATIRDQAVISYTSFDYLGLSDHPKVVAAAQAAIGRYGTSASASRLVGGNSALLADLDREIAELVGTEAAVVFPSGYGTNASVLGHLFGADDLILFDELAHNSIMQGAQLSPARRRPFPHNDFAFVDRLLNDVRGEHRRVVIAIEGVYSMDGDYPDLPGFLDVKRRHEALLYVDEAHSIGVMGPRGRGICEHFGVDPAEGDLWMGTISKALASGGGYLAGRQTLVQYLKYTTPAIVFATATSPANSAAALTAVRCLHAEPERVTRLRENSALFLKLAADCGLDTGNSRETPIIPVITGSSAKALELSHRLLAHNIDAQPILYPAVPEAKARVRFFITAHHTEEQIVHTVQVLAECLGLDSAKG